MRAAINNYLEASSAARRKASTAGGESKPSTTLLGREASHRLPEAHHRFVRLAVRALVLHASLKLVQAHLATSAYSFLKLAPAEQLERDARQHVDKPLPYRAQLILSLSNSCTLNCLDVRIDLAREHLPLTTTRKQVVHGAVTQMAPH